MSAFIRGFMWREVTNKGSSAFDKQALEVRNGLKDNKRWHVSTFTEFKSKNSKAPN